MVSTMAARGREHVLESERGLTLVSTTPETVLNVRNTLDAYHSAMKQSAKHGHKKLDASVIFDAAEAERMSRLKGALALRYTASGSWHPHRGLTELLKKALASKTCDFEFYSWAPVASFKKTWSEWMVDCTKRGSIRAKQVVLATNGYTRHLFPEDFKANIGIAAQYVSCGGGEGRNLMSVCSRPASRPTAATLASLFHPSTTRARIA